MKHVFRVFWEALREFWDELFLLMLMNVVTVLLVIPVVTFPPALAGLWGAANLVAKGRAIHWSDYFEGFRRYLWKAWGLALLNILWPSSCSRTSVSTRRKMYHSTSVPR